MLRITARQWKGENSSAAKDKREMLELRSPLSGVRGARYHIIKRSVAYLHIRESVVCSHSLLYSVLSCMSINVML
jgi:hypothetical protein